MAVLGRPYDGAVLTSRPAILTLFSLALVACGGSDSTQADTKAATETQDPRAGYFHEAESTKLNPPLKQHYAAWKRYFEGTEACNKEASRLYAAGATPRKSVQCHIRREKAMIDAAAPLSAVVSDLDGDYRPACKTQVKRFAAALVKVNAARQRIRADWNAYAKAGTAPPKLQQHNRAADLLIQRFLDKDAARLSTACYTEADRTENNAGTNDG